MYIAVKKYGDSSDKMLMPEDMICVFDTSDCTAELVRVGDLQGIFVENFNSRFGLVKDNDLYSLLPEISDDFVRLENQSTIENLHIGNRIIELELYMSDLCVQGMRIQHNGYDLMDGDAVFLGYVFIFRSYVILRFNSLSPESDDIRWFTVAVDKNDDVYYWNQTLTKTNNRELAVMVDTLSEV